ncbi:MAG: ComEA family DNA-binding protein [Hominilimicola sp.]
MLVLNKKAKIILAAAVFAMITAAGCLIEHYEKDAFIMETVATEDAVSYVPDGNAESDGKININSADETELVKLSGIGEALAQRIIKYREENGPFETIEEIMKVSGISEKKFEAVKEFICAE